MGPNGPTSITLEAIDIYLRLSNRTEPYYVERVLYFIPILDRVYLKDFYDKQAEEIAKQQKKAAATPSPNPRRN